MIPQIPRYDNEKGKWVCNCGKDLWGVCENGKSYDTAYCKDCLINNIVGDLTIGAAFEKGDKFICLDMIFDNILEVKI